MEYRILGPLAVTAGGRPVDVGGPRRQRLLAALLLTPNRVVPVTRLIECLWDGERPATAERQVRNRIGTLWALLARLGGFIDTDRAGYLLRVEPASLDAPVFDELAPHGRAAADPALLREALQLRRGPAFAGLDGAPLAQAARRPGGQAPRCRRGLCRAGTGRRLIRRSRGRTACPRRREPVAGAAGRAVDAGAVPGRQPG